MTTVQGKYNAIANITKYRMSPLLVLDLTLAKGSWLISVFHGVLAK